MLGQKNHDSIPSQGCTVLQAVSHQTMGFPTRPASGCAGEPCLEGLGVHQEQRVLRPMRLSQLVTGLRQKCGFLAKHGVLKGPEIPSFGAAPPSSCCTWAENLENVTGLWQLLRTNMGDEAWLQALLGARFSLRSSCH